MTNHNQAIIADDNKLKELILYICSKSMTDDTFSSVKLNKLLYYSDFSAHRLLGKPITGHLYQAIEFGPAPKQMLPILKAMQRDNDIVIVPRNH